MLAYIRQIRGIKLNEKMRARAHVCVCVCEREREGGGVGRHVPNTHCIPTALKKSGIMIITRFFETAIFKK